MLISQHFKGPPVKDIKREAPRAVYQHSSKARDWSNLGGDLEAVFGGGAGPSQQSEQRKQETATRGGEQDEWGDFAGFSATSPAPLPKQSYPVDHARTFNDGTNMNTIAASNQSIPASAFANPALPPSSNVPSSASFSLPPSSSVGCRLASLAESPVHRYTNNTPNFC